MEDDLPLVSVVIPALNEEGRIGHCLGALVAQTYPRNRIEIIVADGRSSDLTREIVTELAAADRRIRLLDNASGRTPSGLNLAIAASSGSVICRMDAHAVPAGDYVEQCVATLRSTRAWCVGGRMEKHGDTRMAAAIAAAATSPFGIGDSSFHYAKRAQTVESVYLGCWPREVFDRVGFFNESLVRNQDDELSYRIRQAGGIIWFNPRISVRYQGRDTLARLFTQYLQYGFWKVAVFRLHPGAIRWRHTVPPLFVATSVGSLSAGILSRRARIIGLMALGCYAIAAGVASRLTASVGGRARGRDVMAAFATMHVGYGLGVLRGIATLLSALARRVARS